MLIDANIYRALRVIAKDAAAADHLVDEDIRADLLELIHTSIVITEEFDLKSEFTTQYRLVKAALVNIGDIQTKEDLDILKEAKSFLTFILKNEEAANNIEAVKAFKSAVLEALDEESPELRDRVISRLAE